jgi:hypothetical protein
MKRILLSSLVVPWLAAATCSAQEPHTTHDAPPEVMQFLEQATGSWYVRIGQLSSACTVNRRANGRGVVVEGRRFSDAVSFTSLLGWYAPSRQVVGLVIFEHGESLLLRATVRGEADKLTAEGDAVGIVQGRGVKVTFTMTRGEGSWSLEIRTGDETIAGSVRSTGSR